jgi:hypothetical protein
MTEEGTIATKMDEEFRVPKVIPKILYPNIAVMVAKIITMKKLIFLSKDNAERTRGRGQSRGRGRGGKHQSNFALSCTVC